LIKLKDIIYIKTILEKEGAQMPRGNPELAVAMGKRMAARRKELGLTQETVAILDKLTDH
jgi:hypothetical protein